MLQAVFVRAHAMEQRFSLHFFFFFLSLLSSPFLSFSCSFTVTSGLWSCGTKNCTRCTRKWQNSCLATCNLPSHPSGSSRCRNGGRARPWLKRGGCCLRLGSMVCCPYRKRLGTRICGPIYKSPTRFVLIVVRSKRVFLFLPLPI